MASDTNPKGLAMPSIIRPVTIRPVAPWTAERRDRTYTYLVPLIDAFRAAKPEERDAMRRLLALAFQTAGVIEYDGITLDEINGCEHSDTREVGRFEDDGSPAMECYDCGADVDPGLCDHPSWTDDGGDRYCCTRCGAWYDEFVGGDEE